MKNSLFFLPVLADTTEIICELSDASHHNAMPRHDSDNRTVYAFLFFKQPCSASFNQTQNRLCRPFCPCPIKKLLEVEVHNAMPRHDFNNRTEHSPLEFKQPYSASFTQPLPDYVQHSALTESIVNLQVPKGSRFVSQVRS